MPTLQLTFTAHDLAAKDSFMTGGKSDPYLVLLQSDKEIGRSEVIANNLNPTWPPFVVSTDDLKCAEYTMQCWDADKIGSDDLIGTATCTLEELLSDEKEFQLTIAGKQSGWVRVVSGEIEAKAEESEEKSKTKKKRKPKRDCKEHVREDKSGDDFVTDLVLYAVNPTTRVLKFTFSFHKSSGLTTKEFVVVEPGKEESFCSSTPGKGYRLPQYTWSCKTFAPVEVAPDKPDQPDQPDAPGPGEWFVDPEFACDSCSLGECDATVSKWCLARDLGDRGSGVLFEGVDPLDIRQGQLGDCWLMCAMSCLAAKPEAVTKLFTPQEISPNGKYTVKLFDVVADEFVDITIDEQVPVRVRGDDIQAVFADPMGEEIWVPLLEKAFAKFYGNYGELDGGQTTCAFQSLLGFRVTSRPLASSVPLLARTGPWTVRLRESWLLQKTHGKRCPRENALWGTNTNVSTPGKLWERVKEHVDAGDLLSCGLVKKESDEVVGPCGEGRADLGLVTGHAYAFLQMVEMTLDKGQTFNEQRAVSLVCLRNPWGNGAEWQGAWSDRSEEWKANPKLQLRIQQKSQDDGSFWMAWDDFLIHFTKVAVCHCGAKGRDLDFEELGELQVNMLDPD